MVANDVHHSVVTIVTMHICDSNALHNSIMQFMLGHEVGMSTFTVKLYMEYSKHREIV